MHGGRGTQILGGLSQPCGFLISESVKLDRLETPKWWFRIGDSLNNCTLDQIWESARTPSLFLRSIVQLCEIQRQNHVYRVLWSFLG